jgi:hypothetical protein
MTTHPFIPFCLPAVNRTTRQRQSTEAQGLSFVVVEENRRGVEQLRKRNIPAVYGDATAAGVRGTLGLTAQGD